jgi:hypothetical protein
MPVEETLPGAGNPFEARATKITQYQVIERVSVSERCPGWTFQIFFLLLTKKGKGPAK